MRPYRVWVSIFILLAVGLHGVVPLFPRVKTRTWPFLTWGMYKSSLPPGPISARKSRVIGITQKGRTETVTPVLVGSTTLGFRSLYEGPMWRGDSAAAQHLFRRINRQREDPFVELRLEIETYTVTDTGIVKQNNPGVIYRSGL